MKNDNIIKKITINVAGTDIDVTPLQAKNLYDALADLLKIDRPPTIIEWYAYHDNNCHPDWRWSRLGFVSFGGESSQASVRCQ